MRPIMKCEHFDKNTVSLQIIDPNQFLNALWTPNTATGVLELVIKH